MDVERHASVGLEPVAVEPAAPAPPALARSPAPAPVVTVVQNVSVRLLRAAVAQSVSAAPVP